MGLLHSDSGMRSQEGIGFYAVELPAWGQTAAGEPPIVPQVCASLLTHRQSYSRAVVVAQELPDGWTCAIWAYRRGMIFRDALAMLRAEKPPRMTLRCALARWLLIAPPIFRAG